MAEVGVGGPLLHLLTVWGKRETPWCGNFDIPYERNTRGSICREIIVSVWFFDTQKFYDLISDLFIATKTINMNYCVVTTRKLTIPLNGVGALSVFFNNSFIRASKQ